MSQQFYYQMWNDEIVLDQLPAYAKKMKQDHRFMDNAGTRKDWELLLASAQTGDEVHVPSIEAFASDGEDLKGKLRDCLAKELCLKISKTQEVDPSLCISVMEFVDLTNRKRNHEKQMMGIRKALDEKKQGLRPYGRPSVSIPKDFNENLKRVYNKEMTHDEYRKSIGMKKSTYFAKVKEWREQEK